jgi:hypothetical protein
MNARWIINGVEQEQTPGELVALGQRVLDPTRPYATVVGHGDAHFGNVFLSAKPANEATASTPPASVKEASGQAFRYLYFDPAFAGQHAPLLDIVKPLFHNIFATWMYFPREIAQELRISVRVEDERILVDHNYHLTPVRRAMLRVKREKLLLPLVARLKELGELPEDWRDILRLALMCCPLLTVDLFDATKRPPEIGWLGLSQALQLGNSGLPAWKEDEQ